ncbi:MAG: T9SS C-terminal target domain-containing protein, partial [Fluviicola sp.]
MHPSDVGKANSKPLKPLSHSKGAGCSPANYRKTNQFNDVKAQLETGGLLFLDRANGLATYRVPKNSQSTLIYAAALWMGGLDVNGQLKLAAVKFRNTGNDFWPGPLTVSPGTGNVYPPNNENYGHDVPQLDTAVFPFGEAQIDYDQCLFYDNIWTVTKAAVIEYATWWENCVGTTENCNGMSAPSTEVMQMINTWPGNSDPTRSQDPFLAPFYDRNDNLIYEPDLGEYPWYDDILGKDDIKCGVDRKVSLFGDETHWWVFNDKGNIHTESQGEPIGMEIHAQAFSFATDDEINKMTFYNYLLINRGTQTLENTYFSHYVDADLGGAFDDFAGCDVQRGLAYMYNGDNYDETNGSNIGFGENPPAIGVDFFEGPYQDADGIDNPGPVFDTLTNSWDVPSVAIALAQKGIVYKGLGIGYGDDIIDNERYGMRNFTVYTGGGPDPQSDPSTSAQFYNYMQGLWRFGTELRYGGNGFPGGPSTSPLQTSYMFPNDTDTSNWATNGASVPYSTWSEFEPAGLGSSPNPSGDRRFVQSAGPFTLLPGAVNNITVGIVYGSSTEGEAFSSVNALRVADTKAQALFDNCFRILEPPTAPVVTIQELENELIILLDNPKTSNNYLEQYEEEDKINIVDPIVAPGNPAIIYDKFYRFEGYQIFQMKNAEATVADIDDPTKARPVAQCDIKNGVKRLINFEFDESFGYSIPTEKVDGEDNGIRHTFRVTQDLFATGATELVNHKTYYYLAVAYGYNNYKQYDPNDAAQLDGQKKPYLRSRINADGSPLAGIPAVPHNVA